MIRRHTGTTTFSEFVELIHEDQKADLLEGVIYLASPENTEHNDLVTWLGAILRIYVEERKLGRITVNKVAFRLSKYDAPEPDIAFVAADREHLIKSGYVDGPPDLAIEVVSPESADRDYDEKRRRYESAGVREYWIIDPLDKITTFLVLEKDAFGERPMQADVFHSIALPGFFLDTRWLWQRPLPATMGIVKLLLSHK